MKPCDLSHRFGFVVNDVGRLYGRQFDQLSRSRLGLSRAQCQLLSQLARHRGAGELSQADLAQQLDLTPMGVTTLCNRLEASRWITRRRSATDRRANTVDLEPKAEDALVKANAVSDLVQAKALNGFSEAEREQLLAMLQRVRTNLSSPA